MLFMTQTKNSFHFVEGSVTIVHATIDCCTSKRNWKIVIDVRVEAWILGQMKLQYS